MPYLSFSVQSFPWLCDTTYNVPLKWKRGRTFKILLTTPYVRINNLGIQWCTMCKDLHLDTNWKSFSCIPDINSMCTSTEENITLFPNNRVAEVPISETWPLHFSKLCDTQTANRKIALENNHYDVSLCDLIDRKLDFVWDVHNTHVYWKQNNTPMWWNLLITLSNLYFFTRVCEHLQLLINGKRRKFSGLTTCAIVCLLLLYRILLETKVIFQRLVTQQEFYLSFILELYCWLYIMAELVSFLIHWNRENDRENDRDISTLGSLVAIQLLFTSQLQNTYENPFIIILTLIFGMRVFLKFMRFIIVHTASTKFWFTLRKFCFLSVDTVTLACIFELGVRIAARSQIEYASTATGMLIIIVLSGSFVHSVILSIPVDSCIEFKN